VGLDCGAIGYSVITVKESHVSWGFFSFASGLWQGSVDCAEFAIELI
jgi:hypothetical protein